ncbi:YgiQ family radical SAM protein [Paludicola sp. MB14-C6]|uniref:YgiQ family radical SAM protein n=1 Tax=Paludihabitans sp. MB14-C6 TaxID=3070656 RepID=UPI0027DE68DF|nr:YgiQ family radical SAM protein [Paludicola sp. MB14-C6]WMJ23286.1 YgiQ family radical SAM protein [Paludicola sp. MB14-C6]
MAKFLPISKDDMRDQGIEQLDFIIVTGDAYVDHPSFGTAIISRVIEAEGFTVGIISQPDFHSTKDFMKLGKPKYAFFVNSGNIDSMVAHYTVAKRKRTEDAYTAGKKMGKRPDRAVIVYSKFIKQAYPDLPIIIGGLEASLRRFAHYDYWDDAVRPSILVDSKADILVYGMGEKQTVELIHRLKNGEKANTLTDIKGTCYLTSPANTPWGAVECANFDIVSRDKLNYAKATLKQMNEQDEVVGKTIIQRHGNQMLVQNPPMPALTQEELDKVYALPYMRMYHPCYESEGGVPAIEEVEFSITHNRGCFGACNFCSIAFHQGRRITCRSEESILKEATDFTKNKRFKGYIHDVGGPTANFRHPSCKKQLEHGLCKNGKKCLAPTPCKLLETDHSEYLDILRKLRKIDGIKKVFIRSGIRYDYMLADKSDAFFNELVEHHVSGQLKVAPEHCSNNTLDMMGKPHIEAYREFSRKYFQKTKSMGKEQYLVPYLMSSHPGSTLNDAIELALFLKTEGIRPEQVQDFYPTPGTISTCMYYTGINPYTNEKVYIAKTKEEKAMQRALLQYYKAENRDIITKALTIAKRRDLIGNSANCLVKPISNPKVNPQEINAKSPQGKSTKGARQWQRDAKKGTKRTKR